MLDAADEILAQGALVVDRYTGPIALLDGAGFAHELPVATRGREVVLGNEACIREAAEEAINALPRAGVGRPARTPEDFPDPPPVLAPVVQAPAAKLGRKPRTRRERQRRRERGGR
jgi:hypothetical protein